MFVNANGKLGTATSSLRFKDGIKPMDSDSEAQGRFQRVLSVTAAMIATLVIQPDADFACLLT